MREDTIERSNPLKHLFSKTSLSMREFERKYGISHSALMQLNAGGFREPLDRVVSGLYSELRLQGIDMPTELYEVYGTESLAEAYDEWKVLTRQEWVDTHKLPRVIARGKTRPVKRFIDDGWGGPTGFAKAMAVPYTMTLNWYRGTKRGIPGLIRHAFADIDFDYHVLEDAERRWREAVVKKGTV